jgi:ABC-2 type transport system ATP-binding protein
MSDDLAVDLAGVRKRYRGVEALRGADLRIERGEIFGLLGPNGAGKSTLVKILLTLVRPTGGSGRVLGRPLGDRATLARVGYLPENLRFPEYLTARQAIDYFGSLAKVPRPQRRSRTAELLETVGMSSWADRPVRTYSKGMRQRVGLAVSLVNDPELLVLDEPTDGVDPVGRKEIRDVLVAAAQAGRRSVLLNSHLLSEVEATCTRVAILNQGQVLAQGTIAELSGGDRRYEIEVEDAGTALADSLLQQVESMGGRVAPHEGRWRLAVPGHDAAEVQPLLDALRSASRTVVSLRPVQSSLEELFVKAVSADGGRSRPGGVLRKGVLG